jgi:hypothetical protein
MNSCKRVHQKIHRLRSMIGSLKASVCNRGVLFVNSMILGSPVLRQGQIIHSPGGTFAYQVVGPCCRLYDREQLPWPSCSLSWRGKQPSWRRVGRRFILDVGSRNHPTYAVRLLGQDAASEPMLLTLYWLDLSASDREWWYGKKPGSAVVATPAPVPASVPEAEPACLVGGLV